MSVGICIQYTHMSHDMPALTFTNRWRFVFSFQFDILSAVLCGINRKCALLSISLAIDSVNCGNNCPSNLSSFLSFSIIELLTRNCWFTSMAWIHHHRDEIKSKAHIFNLIRRKIVSPVTNEYIDCDDWWKWLPCRVYCVLDINSTEKHSNGSVGAVI